MRIPSVSLLVVASVLCAGAPAAPDRVPAIFPSGTEFTLEIAADPVSRARGYMFREEVGPTEGMLFLFETAGRHSFWMKNCRVALDIVWLDETLRVVEIAARQQPCPEKGECPTVRPMREARHVIEVAAGVAEREGLGPGDRVILPSGPELP